MTSKIVISITIVSGDLIEDPVTLEISSSPLPVDSSPEVIENTVAELLGSAKWYMRGGSLHPTDPWGKEQME